MLIMEEIHVLVFFLIFLTSFLDIRFINEEITGCINEEVIGTINEAAIGVIIRPKIHFFCF